MVEPVTLTRLIVNIASLIIIIGIFYYANKLLFLTRKGMLEKVWKHISIGALILALGSLSFVIRTFFHAFLNSEIQLDELIIIGAIFSMIGGFFLLIGLRKEYKIWTPKK